MNKRGVNWVGAVLVGVVLCWAAGARAEEKAAGTWKWERTRQDGTKTTTVLKLKQDGETVTGVLIAREGQETKIDDGKFKDGVLSFTVTREFNGQSFKSKYEGKVSGDNVKGTIETERDGQKRSRDWEAKREKTDAATATWKHERTRDDGTTITAILKLKQDGDKLSGVSIYNNEAEVAIENGSVKGNDLAFQVTRERDGDKLVFKFNGTVEGDTLKGKVSWSANGEDRSIDAEYKRVKE